MSSAARDAAFRERLAAATTPDIEEALRFFDCEKLRGHYTGLIADLRRELKQRREDAAGGEPPFSKSKAAC